MNCVVAALVGLGLACGCSARLAEQHEVRPASLCGAPERIMVAEVEGDEDLRQAATDALADGLAGLGFAVLSPRRAPEGRRGGRLDWLFSGEARRSAEGVSAAVAVRSLSENLVVWSIADTRHGARIADPVEDVRRHMGVAVEMFRSDRLGCREAGEGE